MNELTLDGKIYVSSKRAAEITGYAKDYVGQLCREGRVEARLVGRNWYVLKDALEKHRFAEERVEPEKELAEALTTENWSEPIYSTDPEAQKLPLTEPKQEIELNEKVPEAPEGSISIEAMQSAWKDWFAHLDAPEAKIEATEAIVEEGITVELHKSKNDSPPISDGVEEKPLNLRQLRSYTPQEEAGLGEEGAKETKEPEMKAVSQGYYYTVRALLTVLIVASIFVGVVGSGYLDRVIISYKPIQFIAGVIQYSSK